MQADELINLLSNKVEESGNFEVLIPSDYPPASVIGITKVEQGIWLEWPKDKDSKKTVISHKGLTAKLLGNDFY